MPSFQRIPPLCLTPTGYIQVLAKPGPLQFTPSGQVAYMVDTDPTYGRSLLQLTVATHAVASWPPPNSGIAAPDFSDVIVAGENAIYAISTTDPNYPTTLWDVTSSPLERGDRHHLQQHIPAYQRDLRRGVKRIAFGGLPVCPGREREPNQSVSSQFGHDHLDHDFALLGPGLLQFVAVPPETGAAGFYTLQPTNATQTLHGGRFRHADARSCWMAPAGPYTTCQSPSRNPQPTQSPA